jgi:small subunit ribosomal protein S2
MIMSVISKAVEEGLAERKREKEEVKLKEEEESKKAMDAE